MCHYLIIIFIKGIKYSLACADSFCLNLLCKRHLSYLGHSRCVRVLDNTSLFLDFSFKFAYSVFGRASHSLENVENGCRSINRFSHLVTLSI